MMPEPCSNRRCEEMFSRVTFSEGFYIKEFVQPHSIHEPSSGRRSRRYCGHVAYLPIDSQFLCLWGVPRAPEIRLTLFISVPTYFYLFFEDGKTASRSGRWGPEGGEGGGVTRCCLRHCTK